MTYILDDFMPVLGGFLVNLEIAFAAMAIAMALGMPLAILRHAVPRSRRLVQPCLMLMQAAPTYALMFLMLTLLPSGLSIFGMPITGLAAVILAQATYLTVYVADNFQRSLEHHRRGESEQALLLLPNLVRGFFVVIMSSGFGAAIGVSEAVATTMRQAERLHVLSDRIMLFLLVIGFFVVIFSVANVLIRLLVRYLSPATSA